MDVLENLQKLIAIKAIVAVLLAYLIYKLLRLYLFVQKNYDIFGAMPSPPRHWFYGNMHLVRWHKVFTFFILLLMSLHYFS